MSDRKRVKAIWSNKANRQPVEVVKIKAIVRTKDGKTFWSDLDKLTDWQGDISTLMK
jgi:hypothetical protein